MLDLVVAVVVRHGSPVVVRLVTSADAEPHESPVMSTQLVETEKNVVPLRPISSSVAARPVEAATCYLAAHSMLLYPNFELT